MRPQRPQVFQSDASRKLDRLELIAALLERDASQNRAWLAELGGPAHKRPRRFKHVMPDWAELAVGGIAGARATRRRLVAAVTSNRLRSALREAGDFIFDFAVVLGVAAAGTAIFTAALLIAAPPV
jgi:hypothetical protein